MHLCANTVNELRSTAIALLDQIDDGLQLGIGTVQANMAESNNGRAASDDLMLTCSH